MDEIGVEVPPQPRQMGEVGGLAVTLRKPVEDADDPHRALRAENGVSRVEPCLIEVGRRVEVARDHRRLQTRAEVPPRVLQQRDEVVCRRARARILKIQQPDPADPDAPQPRRPRASHIRLPA